MRFIGRRQKEIQVVELECKTIQRIKEPEEDRNTFSLYASFASPEQMDMLRDAIQAGESLLLLCLIFGWNF